jgi:hypothetical protein
VAHELSGAYQQAVRVVDLGSAKEADIDVSCERIDIAKGRIAYARSRVAIMQQFTNIVAAAAHHLKPLPRDRTYLAWPGIKPCLDSRIASDGGGKFEKPLSEHPV